jgi:hypothetical protein
MQDPLDRRIQLAQDQHIGSALFGFQALELVTDVNDGFSGLGHARFLACCGRW